jgi:hypothetical protein
MPNVGVQGQDKSAAFGLSHWNEMLGDDLCKSSGVRDREGRIVRRERSARMVAPARTKNRYSERENWNLSRTANQSQTAAPDAKRKSWCWRGGEK